MPVYTLLARKLDTRWLMIFGLAMFGVSMWTFTYITSGLEWRRAGFLQAFAVARAVNLDLGSLPPKRLKYASGLFNMMRNLGGTVGIGPRGTPFDATI